MRIAGSACALLLCAGTYGAQPASRATMEIERLIAKYTASIDAADTQLAAQVWANSPDVSFIHPLGHEHGWEEVKRNLYQKIMGGMFSERKLTARDIHAQVNGNSAWAEFYWHFVAKLRANGSPVTTDGRETQIYRRTHGRWELVHVHYSALPVVSAQ